MSAYLLEGWEISTARGRPRSELLNQRDVHSKKTARRRSVVIFDY
jgi:hypothetical protein